MDNTIIDERASFEFKGVALEYFKVWIVNLALTALTFGLYSAWAKVRTKRYFYRNLSIKGSAFEYHARPIDLLKGRLILLAALILYLVLAETRPIVAWILLLMWIFLIPWLIVRALTFDARNSSWRNIRFGFRQNTYGESMRVFIWLPMLLLPTLFLIAPYLSYKTWKFFVGNSMFGKSAFTFSTQMGAYYQVFLQSIGIAIITGIFLSGISGIIAFSPPVEALVMLFSLSFVLPYFVYKILAYNISLNGAKFSSHHLESTLSTWEVGKIYLTNAIAIIVSAGLMIPWAKVRVARYQAKHLFLHIHGDLDSFVQGEQQDNRALGAEAFDSMDINIGGV